MNVPYPVDAFLDDQRRLLSAITSRTSTLPDTIEQLDGRLLVIRPDLPRQVPLDRQREVFAGKYGRQAEKSYRARFGLVLSFLGASETEVRECGLAEGEACLAVCEELVGYLLMYELDAKDKEIPRFALGRFLNDWSHRWM